jgi:hypothetical protein
MILNAENSYPFPTWVILFANHFESTVTFITEVDGVGMAKCV